MLSWHHDFDINGEALHEKARTIHQSLDDPVSTVWNNPDLNVNCGVICCNINKERR